jgi:hypothetical protein
MKYLKTFEMDSSSKRKPAYKYLSNENAEKIEDVVRKFLSEKDIPEIISNLKFDDFIMTNFEYFEIFIYKICSNKTGTYSYGSIYYVIDTYMTDNCIISTSPESRNTLFNILKKLYKELNIKSQLDRRLIEILEKKPERYKIRFDNYEDELPKTVKTACKWMLDYRKYNL